LGGYRQALQDQGRDHRSLIKEEMPGPVGSNPAGGLGDGAHGHHVAGVGEPLTEIAKTYNVSHSTISRLPCNGNAGVVAAE
jgi:hypothetical protein